MIKINNKLKFISSIAWIIIAACVAVFFITALIVYPNATPSNVSELLIRDNSWVDRTELATTAGDIEQYPYVTKVDEFETNRERLDICHEKGSKYERNMDYGIIEDPSINSNFKIEFFVFSDIADKTLVKKFWNMPRTESTEAITLTTGNEYHIPSVSASTDIKKANIKYPRYFDTFVRITAKHGSGNVTFRSVYVDTDGTIYTDNYGFGDLT